MKKILIAISLIFLSAQLFSQANTGKIIKIKYKSIPTSQYQANSNSAESSQEKALDQELVNGHQSYYSLHINLANRSSFYKFDSLVITKPKGREDVELGVPDKLDYCIKSDSNATYKVETIFGQSFYSKGKAGDITWSITNEKKQLLGFECTKAVSKNEGSLLTVWFTTSVPVANGPSNYFGLPGLIVWSEDFFRTTQIEKIEYSNDVAGYEKEAKTLRTNFEKEKKYAFITEPLFLVKKAELVQSMREAVLANAQ